MLQIATFKCLWVLDFAASVVCGGEAQRQLNSRDEIHRDQMQMWNSKGTRNQDSGSTDGFNIPDNYRVVSRCF